MIPTMINPVMSTILTLESQNSHSPYMLDPNRLIVTAATRKSDIQRAFEMVSFQRLMSTEMADSSEGRKIVQVYQ